MKSEQDIHIASIITPQQTEPNETVRMILEMVLNETSSAVGAAAAVGSSELPLYLKVLASIFYIVSMILGVGGNLIVLLIYVYYQRTKTVTTFYIINLAISDLIFAILCIPSTYITAYLIQYWPFSGFACIFLNFMQNVSVTLTVNTLICLTLDKFWGLVKPLRLRMSINACKCLIGLSWLISLFVSLPIALFTKLYYISSNDTNQTMPAEAYLPQCGEQWPESIKSLATVYNIFLLLIQYFIPLVFLSFCYINIGIVLKTQKAPGESISGRDARMTQSRQKMIKMCFTMVLTFMISWLPMHLLNVYRFYDEQISFSAHFADLFFVCHLLAVSHCFLNPFIYAWTNSKFRQGVVDIMLCHSISSSASSSLKNRNFTETIRIDSCRFRRDESTRFNDEVGSSSLLKSSSRKGSSYSDRKASLFAQRSTGSSGSRSRDGSKPNRVKNSVSEPPNATENGAAAML